jgi:hypothetical protein
VKTSLTVGIKLDPEAAAKWTDILQQYSLLQEQSPASSTWMTDPAFRRYLAEGSSLAAGADKGLW